MPAKALACLVLVACLAGCAGSQTKEQVVSTDTFECTLAGDRVVVRFDDREARLLIGTERVTLYQIAAASGVRFTNGLMELRGKGTELQLVADGVARELEGCKAMMVPKEEPSLMDRLMPPPKR